MSSLFRISICALAVLACSSALAADVSAEPCLPQHVAAALVANLEDISLTTNELRLLNGKENPKLRRLLEWRLAEAAAEARHHIDEGPAVTAQHLPSLVSGVDRAIKYVAAHPLEQKYLEQVHQRDAGLSGLKGQNVAIPAENLEYVKAWVAKQSWAAVRSSVTPPN
jgi:hypothetical protein